ncbi:ACP S-malonyltransferase, partial [Actinokineospora sp.]|uniref:ACP S-malonyltransferase n=1 Tax=Actinokineospora sp. TaxID=1872133 RepID=UPI003D6A133C
GAQRPGMLDSWVAAAPQAGALLADWSAVAGFDLLDAGRDATAMADTAVAQPLITAAALLSMESLRDRMSLDPDRVLFAGHSVGELAAAAGAGYLTPATAITLARARGEFMSAACAASPTGMAAVRPTRRDGRPDESIVAEIHAAGLAVANWNGSHQFVAAGPVDRVDGFVAKPPAGTRITRLDVAGAFHTDAMITARAPFARAVAEAPLSEPTSAMLGNSDGAIVAGPADLRQRLVTQVTSAVRWDLCAAAIAAQSSPDALHIELAPAGPLTRLLERARPGVRAIAVRAPEDVDRVVAQDLGGVGAAVGGGA